MNMHTPLQAPLEVALAAFTALPLVDRIAVIQRGMSDCNASTSYDDVLVALDRLQGDFAPGGDLDGEFDVPYDWKVVEGVR